MNKRKFIKTVSAGSLGVVYLSNMGLITSCSPREKSKGETDSTKDNTLQKSMFFSISLAQWSLHKALFEGKLDNLDFAGYAKKEFDIDAVEYVNQFFKDKGNDKAYLNDMKKRAADAGVKNILIMIDGEGPLGATDEKERNTAVENHYKWVEAAELLGCHSIRVNAAGNGTAEEVSASAIDGLGKLATFGKDHNIGVIVENHGGYSSNGEWLSHVISQVNMENCGTLPDFGNFCIEHGDDGCKNEYDRYKGVKELMPFAKGVSAKTYNFDEAGNETLIDYKKILQIVKDAGYTGRLGIEYEGNSMSEDEGIRATKTLLEKVGQELS